MALLSILGLQVVALLVIVYSGGRAYGPETRFPIYFWESIDTRKL